MLDKWIGVTGKVIPVIRRYAGNVTAENNFNYCLRTGLSPVLIDLKLTVTQILTDDVHEDTLCIHCGVTIGSR